MATEVSIILIVDTRIIDGAADLAKDSAIDLAAEALAKVAAASMADIEIETMAITHAVEAISAKFILEIANIAAATIHVSSLESAISITRKAAGP